MQRTPDGYVILHPGDDDRTISPGAVLVWQDDEEMDPADGSPLCCVGIKRAQGRTEYGEPMPMSKATQTARELVAWGGLARELDADLVVSE